MNVTASPKTKTEQDCLRYGKTGSFQLDDFIAGWVGGAAGVIVGHPLDTVKTRLQAGQGYGNTFNCVRTIYRNEAVTGFFKGMSFPLISIAAYNSLVFGVFSSTQRFICQYRYGKPYHPPALTDITLASMVTGAFSVGIGCPVDLVKIRLQMQTQTFPKANLEMKHKATGISVQAAYRGPIHCVATILQQEGLPGLFRGIISWGTATPMDVVKCRLQADGVYLNKYKGVIDCIYQSYNSEGLKVFFRGLTVNTVRGFPVSAATFLGYELSLKALRKEAETNP
ncbi:solute carrier family 25 member 48 isoform X3 [Pseudonaja textilis]|uniref:solute carrier family 25 member 48 isoform X3 n=1 Tax=Pseudonaja textilis TaxID=8673 RepID=UPI000EA9DD12|nr:solute carrier family 25 member 48 isoform X3 [Pseudonaja textilis]